MEREGRRRRRRAAKILPRSPRRRLLTPPPPPSPSLRPSSHPIGHGGPSLSFVAYGNQTPGVSSVGVRENVTPNSGTLTPFAVKQMFWRRQPVSGAAAWADQEGGGRRSNNSVSASFEAM